MPRYEKSWPIASRKTNPQTERHAMSQFDLEQSDKFCIFRCDDQTFAIPALSVRCVKPHVELTSLPLANDSFSGIAKIQQEFVPVYSLVENPTGESESQQNKLLVLDRDTGNWGLLVDQVHVLAELEVSIHPSADMQDSYVIGTATHNESMVSVLDPESVYSSLNKGLHSYWNSFESNPGELVTS